MATTKIAWQIVCPNCHKANLESSPYCSRCGASISNVARVQVQQETPPASARTEALHKFLTDGQDPALVMWSYERVCQILTVGEEIEYIAISSKSATSIAVDCVIATNKRLLNFKKKLLGKMDMDSCSWRDVRNMSSTDARHGTNLVVETIQGWRLSVESLPKTQVLRLYEVGAKDNLRLQTILHQMLSAVTASPPDETAQPQTASAASLQEGHDHTPLAAIPAVAAAFPAGLSSASPLPLGEPYPQAPDHAREGQTFPTLHAQTPAPLTDSTNSAPPSMNGLDDLLSNLFDEEEHESRRSDETPAYQPSFGTHGTQADSFPPAEQPREPLTLRAPKPSPRPDYLAAAHLAPPRAAAPNSEASNNSRSSSSNSSSRPPNIDGVLAMEVAHPDPPESLQKVLTRNWPLATERKQEDGTDAPAAAHIETRKAESPMRKLKQLKRMVDGGLITQDDYEAKKADILARM